MELQQCFIAAIRERNVDEIERLGGESDCEQVKAALMANEAAILTAAFQSGVPELTNAVKTLYSLRGLELRPLLEANSCALLLAAVETNNPDQLAEAVLTYKNAGVVIPSEIAAMLPGASGPETRVSKVRLPPFMQQESFPRSRG